MGWLFWIGPVAGVLIGTTINGVRRGERGRQLVNSLLFAPGGGALGVALGAALVWVVLGGRSPT